MKFCSFFIRRWGLCQLAHTSTIPPGTDSHELAKRMMIQHLTKNGENLDMKMEDKQGYWHVYLFSVMKLHI